MVTFDVIVPVYNVTDYLRQCLDSIVDAAAYCTREKVSIRVIAVDDGSTDGSGILLDQYVNAYQGTVRFSIVHQKNAGVANARNAGLDLVRADWVCFVDSDDLVPRNYFTVILESISAFPAANLVHGELTTFESDVKLSPATKSKQFICGRDISRIIPYTLAESGFYQFVYRSTLLKNLRFEKLVMGEDRLFLARALIAASYVAETNCNLYAYRTRHGSAINSNTSWPKFRDNLKHSILRVLLFVRCHKRIESKIYRHQIGLWIMQSIKEVRSCAS